MTEKILFEDNTFKGVELEVETFTLKTKGFQRKFYIFNEKVRKRISEVGIDILKIRIDYKHFKINNKPVTGGEFYCVADNKTGLLDFSLTCEELNEDI